LAAIFENLLTGPTGRQHLAEEKYYHSLIHVALSAMGFELLSEPAWAKGQGDICLLLPDKIRVLIEMKYRKAEEDHSAEDRAKHLDDGLRKAFDDLVRKYPWPFGMTARESVGIALAVYGRCGVRAGFLEESDLMTRPTPAWRPRPKRTGQRRKPT
jgi:hypothetical protein